MTSHYMFFDILVYILRNLTVTLVFIPGVLLAHITSRTLKLSLDLIDKIIVGISIWSFIFCASATIIGLFTSYLTYFFIIFGIISFIMLLLLLLICLRKVVTVVKRNIVRITLSLPVSLMIVIIVAILLFNSILSLYIPIYHQWDAIIHYLLMAKSVTLTGNFTYNIYYLSKESAFYPPMAPLLYAFLMSISGDYSFRLIGIYYLIMLIIVVYAISLKISQNNITSITASLTFLSFLAIQVLLASESLYLDPLFLLYFSITTYALISSVSNYDSLRETFWLLTASITSSLSFLSNELGIICVFLVFSSIIRRTIKRKYLEEAILIAPHIIYYAWLIIRKYPTDFLTSYGLLLCFTFSLLFFIGPERRMLAGDKSGIKFDRKVVGIFCPFFIPLLFYSSSLVLTSNPSARFMLQDYLAALSYGFIPSGGGPVSPLSYWRWYGLFTSNWMGAYYIVYAILGISLLFLKSRKDKKAELILKCLLVLLLSWSAFYFCNFQGTEYRRLTYFAPIFSVIIAEGVHGLFKDRKLQCIISAYYACYIVTVTYYNWFFRWSFSDYYEKLVNLVDYPGNIISDPFGITVFNTISILVLFSIYYSQKRIKINIRRPLAIMLICFLLASFFIANLSVEYLNFIKVRKRPLNPAFYDSYHTFWFCNDVIEYYNNIINDSYTTLVFEGYALPISFFANRSVVGPAILQTFIPLIDILDYNSTIDLLRKLNERRIKYIIVAKDGLPGSRIRQISFLERYPEFKEIIENKSVKIINFKYFILYKIED